MGCIRAFSFSFEGSTSMDRTSIRDPITLYKITHQKCSYGCLWGGVCGGAAGGCISPSKDEDMEAARFLSFLTLAVVPSSIARDKKSRKNVRSVLHTPSTATCTLCKRLYAQCPRALVFSR